MEIEKLIERLQNWDGIKPDREIDCAIEGLKALQAENNRLKEEVQQMRWIPVEERLPEPTENPVLVHDYSGVSVAWHSRAMGWVYKTGLACVDVTHWMPLPPGPSAKGEE